MELFKSLESRTKLFIEPFKHFEINEPLTKSAIDEPTTKNNNSLYSAFKKAKAPFLIAALMETIFSDPGSCFLTHLALINM